MTEDSKPFNLCEKCHSFIEILNCDGSFIAYKCPNCDENKENKLSIEEFNKSIQNANTCNFCQTSQNSENWKFCVKCKFIICQECINNHNNCDGILMNFDEIGTKCLEHPNNDNELFCLDCKRHICKQCKETKVHQNHSKNDFDEIFSEEDKSNFNRINESLLEIQKGSEKEDEKKKKEISYNYENKKTKIKDEYDEKIKENEKNCQNEIKEEERKCKEEIENFAKLKNEELKKKTQEIKEKTKNQKEEDEKNKENELKKLENAYKKKIKQLQKKKLLREKNINNLMQINDIVNKNYEKNENNYYTCKSMSNLLSNFNKNNVHNYKDGSNEEGDNDDNDDNDDNEIGFNSNNDIDITTSIMKKEPNEKLKKNVLNYSETLIENDCLIACSLDHSIEVFESFNENDEGINIVYPYKNIIKCFNLKKKEVIKEIDSHTNNITGFRHYYDKIENKNLILSISGVDNNLKVWDTEDWNCILDLPKINENGQLYSACFLNANNALYIITSNAYNNGPNDPIKVFDLEGNKIKQFETIRYIYSIDTFFDEEKSKHYIIAGCRGCVESFSYDDGTKYKTYEEMKPDEIYHTTEYEKDTKELEGNNFKIYSFQIFKENEMVKLILCKNDKIKIWDFHGGKCISEIKMTNFGYANCICLWDKNELLIGGFCNLKLINMDKKEEVKGIINNHIIAMKKISTKDSGKFIISLEKEINRFKIKLYK